MLFTVKVLQHNQLTNCLHGVAPCVVNPENTLAAPFIKQSEAVQTCNECNEDPNTFDLYVHWPIIQTVEVDPTVAHQRLN